MTVLLTGAAGFIGMHVALRLLQDGAQVVGIDNFSDEYDPLLKRARAAELCQHDSFELMELDCTDADAMGALFENTHPSRVVHLAAESGVRRSIDAPLGFLQTNITGFLNVLEGCRSVGVEHLVYASSASVYGAERPLPASTAQTAGHPLTLYGATKRSNELMAHVYSTLHDMPTTGLRFFNVYGPWGRPDSALAIFTRAMLAGEPVPIFNHGRHARDFTYVEDIAEGVVRVLTQPPTASSDEGLLDDAATSTAPWRVYNIGRGEGVDLLRFVDLLEAELGVTAIRDLQPMQPGDIEDSWADITQLQQAVGYTPDTTVEDGVRAWVNWYRCWADGINATMEA